GIRNPRRRPRRVRTDRNLEENNLPTDHLIESLRGRLVVSCQAYPGEPMRTPETMRRVAQAVVAGGAAGVRAKGIEDIAEMRACLTVHIIGLVKEGEDGVFITPPHDLAHACARAGADSVAIDGTRRARPDGRSVA